MSSFAGSITALFVAGMVGGYAGLCLRLAECGPQVPRLDRAACGSGGGQDRRRAEGQRKRAASRQAPGHRRAACDGDAALDGGAAFDGRNDPADAGSGAAAGSRSRARSSGRAGTASRAGDAGSGQDARVQVAHGFALQEQGIGRGPRLRGQSERCAAQRLCLRRSAAAVREPAELGPGQVLLQLQATQRVVVVMLRLQLVFGAYRS
jgi:hypothetical protein